MLKFTPILFLLLPTLGIAQTGRTSTQPSSPASVSTSSGNIHGRVVLPDGRFINNPAKITLKLMRGTFSTTYTDSQGQFDFRNLTSGNYTIEVEADTQPQFDVTSEEVQVFKSMTSFVTLALKEKNATAVRTSQKTISAHEFDNDVPAAAKKEYNLGVEASSHGQMNEGISHFVKSIALYPNYLMAHNDLGSCFLQAGKIKEAADEFRAALLIDSKAFNPRLNLGIALVRQHKYAEAIPILENALSIESDSAAALFYLGLAHMATRDFVNSEKELKAAYDFDKTHFALALFHIGQIYMSRGERSAALQAFEEYLRSEPHAANSAQVEKLISILR